MEENIILTSFKFKVFIYSSEVDRSVRGILALVPIIPAMTLKLTSKGGEPES